MVPSPREALAANALCLFASQYQDPAHAALFPLLPQTKRSARSCHPYLAGCGRLVPPCIKVNARAWLGADPIEAAVLHGIDRALRQQEPLIRPVHEYTTRVGQRMLIARYGGKRPLLRSAFYLLAYRLGAFRAYVDIDWSRVQRLVIACHGNICRSPYAESRARQLGFVAVSFGLRALPGARADSAAVTNAAKRGVDLIPHRSRSLDTITLGSSDLLVAMEPRQAQRLCRFARAASAQLTLQGLWASTPRPCVPDPYGQDDVCFQHGYALIDSSLQYMKSMIRGPHAPGGEDDYSKACERTANAEIMNKFY